MSEGTILMSLIAPVGIGCIVGLLLIAELEDDLDEIFELLDELKTKIAELEQAKK